MAYEFLKNLFGTNEDGTPKAMTADELEKAIVAGKVKVVDLGTGDYVDKNKFDRQAEELKTVKGQLTEANTQIQSYKDMDIEGVKQAAATWEEKYNTDTAALNKRLQDQEYNFAVKSYLGQYDFTDPLAAEGVQARFAQQKFKLGTDGKFAGADEFMENLKKSNPGAFKAAPAQDPKMPMFTNPSNGGNPPAAGARKMTLDEIMAYANANPGANIDVLLQNLG